MTADFANFVAVLLLIFAIAHIFFSKTTDAWMSKPGVVRVVGALLLALALIFLFGRGWFYWTLAAALAVSGVWRLCFPRHSIRTQQSSYPRWVHGCLLLGAAILVWVLRP
jgi:hypothetical protein